MPFKRYVELGRVAMINFGEEYGKLVVIVDVVDQNRALIDRPGEQRRMINFKRLTLTDFKLDIPPRLAKQSELKAKLAEAEVYKKFDKSGWGQKLAKRKAKAKMSDFDRYKAGVQKSTRSKKINAVYNKLRKKKTTTTK